MDGQDTRTNDYSGEQSQITDNDLGNNNVYFLPYLMGERSPHNDEFARGTFTGMTMDTERKDMTQAVLEGVAFAIRDCFEVAKSLSIKVESTRMCGGGAKSELWCKIMANVLWNFCGIVRVRGRSCYGCGNACHGCSRGV